MRSATFVPLALALVLGIGAWVTIATNTNDGAGPPAARDERASGQAPPAAPAPIERQPASDAGPERPAPPAEPPVVAPRVEPTETAANVLLHVRRIADHGDVAAFTWRFRSDDAVVRGDGDQARTGLHLPPGDTGELLVEAPGFAPFLTDVVVPAAAGPPLAVDAFLGATARATGITLLVHDTALQPIGTVRVDAFPLLAEGSRDAWHLGASLWARRTEAADGRYELPELAPGDYGIRVLAVDAAGEPLPLLPYLHTFTLTGSSGYLEDVVLEPGSVPEFELVDANGAPLDPAQTGSVGLRLYPAGGAAVPRLWTVRSEARTTAALDMLPASGVVSTAQPVAPGTYTFEVSIAGQQRVQQFVTLRAGERQRERIVVP